MARLLIHVEGQTEETFVNEVLAPHLYSYGLLSVGARLLGGRGGIRGWDAARRDILKHLRQDRECFNTTMVDYYALPQTRARAWPGRHGAGSLAFERKAGAVEQALLDDIAQEMGDGFDRRRFIPFVTMHEFEGLLFSDCERFGNAIGRPELFGPFQAIRDQFATPEEINDSPFTAPSKRVKNLAPNYEKPLFGALAALAIGLDAICAECPHFRAWVRALEGLVSQ